MVNRIVSGARMRLRLEHLEEAERRLVVDQCSAGVEAIAAIAFFACCLFFWVGTP